MEIKDLIPGKFRTLKVMNFYREDFPYSTREEILADIEAKKASGGFEDEEGYNDALKTVSKAFDYITEFGSDNKVYFWISVTDDGMSEEEAKKMAEEQGFVYKDGFISPDVKEWKVENGEYIYNTGEHREILGEVKSPWDKLELNADGLLSMGDGMGLLEPIK